MSSCISSALSRADKLVDSTMSQKRTLSSLRSGPGVARRLGAVRLWVPSTIDLALLLLRLALDFRRLGRAQLGDRREHDLAVAERDAELLQVGVVQVRQGAKVDVVFGKDFGIFA